MKTRIYARLITLNENLWIDLITDIDMEEKDAKMKFLHPSLSSTSFVCLQRDDLCSVPFSNIHCKINVPSATSLGRSYTITDKEV